MAVTVLQSLCWSILVRLPIRLSLSCWYKNYLIFVGRLTKLSGISGLN